MLSRFVIAFLPRSKCLLISWLHSPSAVILEPKKIKSDTVSPSICHEVMGPDAMIFVFRMLSFKSTFSLSSFTFINRLFNSSLSAIRVVSSAYLRLLIFLSAILTPACASSSLAFHIMSSAYKLNKHSDNIQPWLTPFLIWNKSVFPCPVLTVASWPAYSFLRRHVRWSDIPISFRIFFSSVQLLSSVWLFVTPWTAALQASLSITKSQSPPKPMSIVSVMPSNHLILCRPLLLLPSIFSSIRVFSNESALRITWPNYCSFSFNISPSNEHPGQIFRMDWLDLLAVQGTLKSLLQHHSSKASVLLCSAFFIFQLSHPYMTTGKTIALTRRTY